MEVLQVHKDYSADYWKESRCPASFRYRPSATSTVARRALEHWSPQVLAWWVEFPHRTQVSESAPHWYLGPQWEGRISTCKK